jgi:hypothetical protein
MTMINVAAGQTTGKYAMTSIAAYLFFRPITSPAKMVISAASVDSVPTIR